MRSGEGGGVVMEYHVYGIENVGNCNVESRGVRGGLSLDRS